jgi:hypothetical protein
VSAARFPRFWHFWQTPFGLFVALQAGWWAAAGGAAFGPSLLGPSVIAALLWVQTRGLAREEKRRLAWAIAGLALAGTLLDSLQVAIGAIRFAGSWTSWLAPLWITALWAHFATALGSRERLAAGRRWRLALLGAVGGPLAYWGGVRIGAAVFPEGMAFAFVTLGAEWALALPLAVRLALAGGTRTTRREIEHASNR